MRTTVIAARRRGEARRLAAATTLIAPGAMADVIHVLEDEGEESYVYGRATVDAAVEHLRAHRHAAFGHVQHALDRPVAECLAEEAASRHADLLVMGSRGLSRAQSVLRSSVSHGLLARSDQAALVVPDQAPIPTRGVTRVLAAIGDVEDEQPVVAAIAALPATPEVLLVHVRRPLTVRSGTPAGIYVEVPETSADLLAGPERTLRRRRVKVSASYLDGTGGVAEQVAAAARERGADLIVVASRRPGRWSALLGGSTGHGVIHHADRMVLLAPSAAGAERPRPPA
jgi:nucleotide-binding universal stress UspA family protein